ncbi:hypothetical protein Tco_0240928 [Tanacetum coccineum]
MVVLDCGVRGHPATAEEEKDTVTLQCIRMEAIAQVRVWPLNDAVSLRLATVSASNTILIAVKTMLEPRADVSTAILTGLEESSIWHQYWTFKGIEDMGKTYSNYSYCFKEIINDESATVSLTCFSPEAHKIITDCNTIVDELDNKDPYHHPPPLKTVEGTKHDIQFHLNAGNRLGQADFILDEVLDGKPLSLMPANANLDAPATDSNIEAAEQTGNKNVILTANK